MLAASISSPRRCCRCLDIPRQKQVNFRLTLDNNNGAACANVFKQLRQLIRQHRATVDAPYPSAGMIGVRPFLPDGLFSFAVGGRSFAALDNENDIAVFILVRKLVDGRGSCFGVTFAVGLRRLYSERDAGPNEVDTVEVLDQRDHVAASIAAPTVPDLFLDVDRKSILTSASRARSDTFDPPAQLDTTLRDNAVSGTERALLTCSAEGPCRAVMGARLKKSRSQFRERQSSSKRNFLRVVVGAGGSSVCSGGSSSCGGCNTVVGSAINFSFGSQPTMLNVGNFTRPIERSRCG